MKIMKMMIMKEKKLIIYQVQVNLLIIKKTLKKKY